MSLPSYISDNTQKTAPLFLSRISTTLPFIVYSISGYSYWYTSVLYSPWSNPIGLNSGMPFASKSKSKEPAFCVMQVDKVGKSLKSSCLS
jgi:hypothetical protein